MTHSPTWHQAVAFAVTGQRFEELGHQASLDLDELAAFLSRRFDVDLDRGVLDQPHPLPADLAAGLGAAQVWAAASELRRRLRTSGQAATVAPQRPLTVEERRLLEEVPPHHGS
ncbi:MAG: hypothetical protein ACJ72K_06460 [Friedmanniella sp.]